MRKMGFALLVGLIALIATVAMTAFQPSVQAASSARGQIEIDLIIELGPDAAGITTSAEEIIRVVLSTGSYAVDSFFDITYVSNVGSYAVDSFFDITYSIDRSIDIELVALSLSATLADPANPGEVIDAIKKALEGVGTVHYGHVTVLK